MMGQRAPFNQHNQQLEAARQENLVKIQRLRQTLEAAQQQELQFKSQLEVSECLINLYVYFMNFILQLILVIVVLYAADIFILVDDLYCYTIVH